MARSKVMRVAPKFKKYIDDIQKDTGLDASDVTERIADIRPLRVKKRS